MNLDWLHQAILDANRIIEATSGPDWRDRFWLGLMAAAFFAGLAFVVWLGLRART